MMNSFIPRRRFDPSVPEMMDRPGIDEKLLREDLRNLRIINRCFGGHAATRRAMKPLLQQFSAEHCIEILDLATGSADLPVVIAKLARSRNQAVSITAIDKNPVMLQVARDMTKGFPEIHLEEGDILNLSFPDRSFDITTCSLAIHHFSKSDAVSIMRTMKRLSRVALVVHDLRRSWLGAWTAWLYTHLTTRNPLTLHDSTLSVLRAFTKGELEEMAKEAGITDFTISKHPFFRILLTSTKTRQP